MTSRPPPRRRAIIVSLHVTTSDSKAHQQPTNRQALHLDEEFSNTTYRDLLDLARLPRPAVISALRLTGPSSRL